MATIHAEQEAACDWPTAEALGEQIRNARRAVDEVRHAVEERAADAATTIRRRPIAAVGVAAAAGLAAGLLIGVSIACLARKRA